MDDPNKRSCGQPQPPEGYQTQKPTQGYQEPEPTKPGYQTEPKSPGDYKEPAPTKPGYKPEPTEPKPPRECAEPEEPKDPCSDPTAPTPPETCDAQPFGDVIKNLEEQSNQEDRESRKGELAAYKKLSDEVWKAQRDYAREYDNLVFQRLNSEAFYEKVHADLLNGRISASEQRRIAEIVYCAAKVDGLREDWIKVRDLLPELQSKVTEAQNKFSDQDEIYKAALTEHQTAQKQLDTLQAQTSKEFNARNYRGAWFLNEFEMCPDLDPPPPLPCEFNKWLEGIADKHVKLSEELRKAKLALDQKTAEAQKKKKDFEDAKSKRRENILKAIASDPFPPDPKSMNPTSQTTSNKYQPTAA